jgi:PAS domain S-box-containing protein
VALLSDTERKFNYVSEAVNKLYGCTPEEIIQNPDLIYGKLHPDDIGELIEKEKQALKNMSIFKAEARVFNPDGSIRWSYFVSKPRIINDIPCWDGIELNITERKQTEEKVIKGIKEKEILLRELYHRTKNNMAVINALLQMQSGYSNDEQLQNILQETQNRINSMAMVHQKLYESQDLSHINLKEYINELIQLLITSYVEPAGNIEFNMRLNDVNVLIDTAIPCGLILNELITNSLKYAFPDNRSGEIFIELYRAEDNKITLIVKDNGTGFPDGFDIHKDRGMGMQVLFLLAENQLKANIDYNSEDGVKCTLNFEDNLYQKRI